MPRPQARPVGGQRPSPDLRWLRQRELWGGVLGLLSLLAALALLSLVRGALGVAVARFQRSLFGWGAYPTVVLGLAVSAWLVAGERWALRLNIRSSQVLGLELFLLGCLGLLHVPFPYEEGFAVAQAGRAGGYVGWALVYTLGSLVSRLGAGLILLLAAIGGAALLFDISWGLLVAATGLAERLAPSPPAEDTPPPRPLAPATEKPPPRPRPKPTPGAPPAAPRRRMRSARLPSLDLLAPASPASVDDADVRYQSQIIEETLAHFGVPAQVVETQRGPTVTQFGVEPGFLERRGNDGVALKRKVRVRRITTLSNDLALALSAPSIRIEAPVPGRPLVGIEVPNRKAALVNLRSVMESDAFQRIRSPLRVALGQDVSGRPVAADLASMPHLLIAGATGSGKSVCINALIACLLLENSPDGLKLVLIDPKRVELNSFNGVPHLVAPVVVEVEQTVGALRWLCQEMDRRYKLFAQFKVRHIEGFNQGVGRRKGERLPYLVVFVDELADLMMVAPEEVERSLCRLAQMGRATGIHLVVATQRPSVDVVTGLIKANFPARIAFAVSTQVDSRVILDAAGAEQLLGRGDMLLMSPEANRLLRLQGCFVSDAELEAIAGYWRRAVEAEADAEEPDAPWQGLALEDDGEDPLLSQAAELIGQQSQASTSFLQRRLRIGYTRAARLMEALEERGLVGPDPGGGRSRQVLPGPAGEGSKKERDDDEEEA